MHAETVTTSSAVAHDSHRTMDSKLAGSVSLQLATGTALKKFQYCHGAIFMYMLLDRCLCVSPQSKYTVYY